MNLVKHYKVKQKHPHKKSNVTPLCFAYEKDFEQIYAFYCARYENITSDEFLKLGITDFMMKLNSIPETEPLYNIIKSRVINIATIKDKEERKYWRKQKQINKIPDIYLSNEELDMNLKNLMGGLKNGKRFM